MSRMAWLVPLALALFACNGAAQLKVEITAPRDGASVPERPFVEGKVSDPSKAVWVVVHPLAVNDRWVQPRPDVRNDGRWKVQIYVGRPGPADVGGKFDIKAFADPESELREGMVLPDWPKARASSDLFEVTRK